MVNFQFPIQISFFRISSRFACEINFKAKLSSNGKFVWFSKFLAEGIFSAWVLLQNFCTIIKHNTVKMHVLDILKHLFAHSGEIDN